MPPPRIGLFGAFDSGRYGDLLLPLIVERELRRRIPSASISFYSPSGGVAKSGLVAEPAGDAHDVDLTVDVGEVDALPLVADLFPPDVLERRLRQLRAIGAYPSSGHPCIIDPAATDLDFAHDLVVIAATPGEDAEAHALRERAGRKIYIIDSNATVEDIPAAIAHASAYLGSSPDLAAIARAFEARDEAQLTALSVHFDRIAEEAKRRAAQRAHTSVADLQRREIAALTARYDALRNAHQALREHAVTERAVFAEAVNRFEEGDLDPAMLVRDNAYLLREWSDAKHAHALLEQRAQAAETELSEIAAAQDQLRDKLDERLHELALTRLDLQRLVAELGQARQELQRNRERLEIAEAENDRNRLVLRTRSVSAVLRVQRWLARWRRK